ncbi:probable E3 ubiquitin-protein ligase bre1 [Aphidius gifuensis]|uniref:probable E3 ubiquitin-protein ligase bre1 n=1 Tax=Aphidius gifuensis TaxID=684658 RepID=UPI001CDC79B8|nr:probable E3 ubiquitin-protein ligase bre1 [Aphidius gifuensis]
MNKYIKSNEHKVLVEKSKVGSTKLVTEATRYSGYDDNSDRLDQQQRQVDNVNIDINKCDDKMILKKRKISSDEIYSKKRFKEEEEKLFTEQSITIKDEMLPVTDDSIDIVEINNSDNHSLGPEIKSNEISKESVTIEDETLLITDDSIVVDIINNSSDHSIGLEKKSNEISNSFKDYNQSCSNEVIEIVDHQKNTRIRTGSLASTKYSVCKIKVTSEISFKEKTRVVKLASENPSWSLDMLREHSGCKNIKSRYQVELWKNQIERGGTLRQKMNVVNNWVINKCIENQKKGEVVTHAKIKRWGLEAKKIFKPIKFSASVGWLRILKINHEITGQPNNLKIDCNLQKKESLTFSRVFVPHEIKVKVVNLANENPHWSLKMLRKQSGCINLENIGQLDYWRQALEKADQHLFTDSFNVCWELLKKKEYYLSERETNIFSTLSLDYGHDMYEAMVIFMKKIINSNKHKLAVKKSKVGSIEIVTTEATCDSGYDDNYNQSNQQQQEQVDKVNIDIDNSQGKMISKKRKISVDETKKIFEADNKKNNCDDSSYAKNIRIEEKLFSEQSITIKDEMLPVTDDSIDVDKINNSGNHSIGLKRRSNKVSNSFNNNNQSCSNEVIENVDHQKNTRIRTGSLARKKYSVYTEKDDELSCTADENKVGNCLNLERKIKITNEISFELKTRVVKLACEHPTWSLKMFRKHSGSGATRDSGYDDTYDQLNQQQQQQQQQQVNKVNIDIDNSHDKMISKKRKISVDEIHSNKIFKADNCDDPSFAQSIRIASLNKNLVKELHMIGMIEKEEELFRKESITIKDEMLPVTDDLIDVDKINNYHDHSFKNNCDYSSNAKNIQIPTSNEEESVSIKDEILLITGDSIDVDKINNSNDYSIGLEIKSNEISTFIKSNNQNCSNESIVNADHQRSTKLRTGSLAAKKYSFHTEKDNKTNNCDDSNQAETIQITFSNDNSIDKSNMVDFIEKEEKLV